MTIEPMYPRSDEPAQDQLERIYQLALVGQAALHTNLTAPHVDTAVATLFQMIQDLAGDSADKLSQFDTEHP